MPSPSQPSDDRAPEQTPEQTSGQTQAQTLEPSPTRRRVEQASLPALEALGRLPVWLPFLVLLGLLLVGGFVGGPVGWVLVGAALLFILWLLYLSWPRLTTVERVMRLTVLLLFVVVAITQLVPRG